MADLTLQDISDDQKLSIEDIIPDVSTDVPQTTPSSDSNKASVAALLSDDPMQVVQTFDLVQQESMEGSSQASDQIIQAERKRSTEATQQAQLEILGDQNVPIETRMAVAQEVESPREKTSTELFKEAALSADSEGETDRSELVRMMMAPNIEEIEKVERAKQAALNAEIMKLDSRSGRALAEMIEVHMFPGAETAQAQKIHKALTGEYHPSILLGEIQVSANEHLRMVPPEHQLDLTNDLINAVNQEGQELFLMHDNDYSKFLWLRDVGMAGEIPDFDRWVNNVASVLEASYLLSPFAGLLKASARTVKAIRSQVAPARTGSQLKTTNPGKFRRSLEASVADETGGVSKTVHGSTVDDAVADAVAPQVAGPDTPVESAVTKPTMPMDVATAQESEIIRFYNNMDDIQYTTKEIEQMEVGVWTRLGEARVHPGHSQVTHDHNGFQVKTVIGGQDGGYLTAAEAMEEAEFGLRHFDVDPGDFSLLKRMEDGQYHVADVAAEAGQQGDYMVQANFKYKNNPLDITRWDAEAPKHRLFAPVTRALAIKHPVLNRYLFSPSAVQAESVFFSAGRAVELQSGLEKTILHETAEWARMYNKLGKESQGKVWDYIRESNYNKVQHTEHEMVGLGFTPKEREALGAWRKKWDAMYWLENSDKVKTARVQGQKVYQDGQNFLTARPIAGPKGVSTLSKIYDPVSDTVRTLHADEIEALYDAGGQVGKLSDDITRNGEVVTHIMVPNKKGSFFREVRDTDQLLDYTPGYYRVEYKDSHFVRQKIYEKGEWTGKYRARFVEGSHADGLKTLERLAKEEGVTPEQYGIVTRGTEETMRDFNHQMDITSGRSAQRFRGQRLESSSVSPQAGQNGAHLKDPVQSMIDASRSIARRTSMRTWLEGQKARWLANYGDLTRVENGQPVFPVHFKDIGDSMTDHRVLADARTAWEYIDYMEDGYVNSLDLGIKGVLNEVADTVGEMANKYDSKALAGLEKGVATVAKATPTAYSRNIAFQAYLALSPVRQLLVQSHQFTQLFALEPAYFTTRLHRDVMGVVLASAFKNPKAGAKVMGISEQEMKRVVDGWHHTGLSASIDRHVLVEGSLNQLIDSTKFGKAGTLKAKATAVATAPRRAGFDAGEYFNQLTAYLTFRNRNVKKGIDADSFENVAKAAAASRNFTYNMNRAGDMPYNAGMLGTIMQFMQVPHKAVETMTLNRSLNGWEKSRLIGFNALMYGVPTALITEEMLKWTEDKDFVREVAIHGMESAVLNWSLTHAFDGETRLSAQNLKPTELRGLYEIFGSFYDGGLGKVYEGSPSGALFGSNGRISNAMRDVAAFTNYTQDGSWEWKSFEQALHGLASVSSGYSNYFALKMSIESGKRFSSTGGVLDTDLTVPEQVAIIFGVPTQDMLAAMEVSEKSYRESKQFEDDVRTWYRDQRRVLMTQDITTDKIREFVHAMSTAWVVWEGETGDLARSIILAEINKDSNKGDHTTFEAMRKLSGIKTSQEIMEMAQRADVSPATMQMLEDTFGLLAKREEE